MALVHDRCICLRKTEYSETSQILTLFSRTYGIVRLIAKGAHRRTKAGASKFDGGVDFLDIGQAVFSHDPAKDLPFLAEWNLREGNLTLRRTLRGIYLGLYAAELVAHLIEEHDAHPPLFDRLEQLFQNLATPRREQEFLAFEINLLREVGYMPELHICVQCGAAVDLRLSTFMSPGRGGVVCANCHLATPDCVQMDVRLLSLMQAMSRLLLQKGADARLPQLTRHQSDPINRALAAHIQHALGKKLRMPKWIL